MLVLSRNEGESIIFNLPSGEQITVTLTEYSGLQTKVGIEAPKDVKVLREELLNEK